MLGKLLEQSRLQLATISPLFNQLHTVVKIQMISNQLPLAPQLRSHYSWLYVRTSVHSIMILALDSSITTWTDQLYYWDIYRKLEGRALSNCCVCLHEKGK